METDTLTKQSFARLPRAEQVHLLVWHYGPLTTTQVRKTLGITPGAARGAVRRAAAYGYTVRDGSKWRNTSYGTDLALAAFGLSTINESETEKIEGIPAFVR